VTDTTFWPGGAFTPHDFAEPQLLIESLLPWGGSMLMHGPRTAGKTQLALALASAVHHGGKFLDKYQCQKARVAYVEVDMTAKTLQARVRAAMNGLSEIAYVTADGPIDVQRETVFNQTFVALREYEPQLVIVDSLRKTHKYDENDSNTPTLVYTKWRELVPRTAFCYLHHDRKVPTGPFAGDVDEAFRGSSAWLDDVDTGLHLVRDKHAKGHRAILTFSKVRLDEQQPPIAVALDPTTMLAIPADATARLALNGWLANNTGASTSQAVAFLTKNGICGRALAYELAKEFRLST
jgi:AAA domain